MKKIITVLLSVLLIAGLFTGCNGDAVSEVVNPKLLRSFDSVWLGDKPPYGEFSQALYGEIVNFVSSGSKEADAVFVNDIEKISKEDLTYLLKKGMENIPIIIIEPDDGDISILQGLKPEDYGVKYLSNSVFFNHLIALADDLTAMDGKWEAAAVKGSEIYIVSSSEYSVSKTEVEKYGDEATDESEGPEPVEGYEPKTQPDINRVRLESFCEWIAEKYDAGNGIVTVQDRNAGPLNLQESFHDTLTYSFEVRAPMESFIGKHSAFVKYEVKVWPVHSFQENNDYYVIEENVFVNNEPMHCGPDATDGWNITWEGKKHPNKFWWENQWWNGWYGPFVRQVSVKHTPSSTAISYHGGGIFEDANPQTTQMSQTFTEGSSFNLSGNVGIGTSGPSASLGGGVTFSSSRSVTVPDLAVVLFAGPKWDYNPRIPEVRRQAPFYRTPRHDIAPTVTSKGLHIYKNSWRYKMTNTRNGSTFDFDADLSIKTTILLGYANLFTWRGKSYTESTDVRIHVNMSAPCRGKGQYTCGFESLDGQQLSILEKVAVDNYLKKLTGGWWDVVVWVYEVYQRWEGHLDSAARDGLNSAVDRFEKNVTYFNKTLGLRGLYKFYMYRSENANVRFERIVDMGGM